MNPKAVAHKLVPSYGPTFLLGSACMIAAAVAAELHSRGRTLYYLAAMANGIQNGMTSTYSANLIRTSHLTGTSTDIGLIMGQMLRGERKNYWKFKVLVGLATSFWTGGLVSFYSARHFLHHSLWFSAALYLTIGLTLVTYVVATQRVSFLQACVGNWKWDQVIVQLATSMNGGDAPTALSALTPDQVDDVFDGIDADGSGEIDADELKKALDHMGIKLTRKAVAAMISVVDENGDGVVDREEFHALVSMATVRASMKREKRQATLSKRTTVKFRRSTVDKNPFGSGDSSSPIEGGESGRSRENVAASGSSSSMHGPLPRTYEEALAPPNGDDRAIVVTEAKYPFNVVGCNEPWEDLCGYRGDEAVHKNMSNLIQGPETNREGIRRAMDELHAGAQHVECTTVNYRKDGTTFKNFLRMGPLYDDEDGYDDVEGGKRMPAYYVGILMNLGELAQKIGDSDWEEKVGDNELARPQDTSDERPRVCFAEDRMERNVVDEPSQRRAIPEEDKNNDEEGADDNFGRKMGFVADEEKGGY